MVVLAGIGKESRARLSKVLARNAGVITSAVVADILGLPPTEANRVLARWCASGWVFRVKRGAYIAVPLDSTTGNIVPEEPFLIADALYQPGYVSGFSAIKHWDLSEQIIETVYFSTTRQVKDRSPVHGGIQFKLKTITESRLFGTKTLWFGSKKVKVSDATKTVVDILDDPALVGGMSIVYDIFREYAESEYCDFTRLLDYAARMNNKTLLKRLGFMLDVKFAVVPEALSGLKGYISAGYSEFDPLVRGKCFVEQWKLKVPTSWKEEYDRKKRSS